MMRKATRSYSKLLLLVVTVSVLFVADAAGPARHRQKPQNKERARVGGTAGLTQLQNKVKAQMSLISARKSQTGKQDQPTLQSLLDRINQIEDQLQPVYFNAFRETGYLYTETAIPYTGTTLNVGGGMNAETGIFTAPKDGNYYFIFTALAISSRLKLEASFELRLNGIKTLSRSSLLRDHGQDAIALQTTVNMKKGDTVNAFLVLGSLYDSPNRHTQFTGFVLMPEAPTPKPEAPTPKPEAPMTKFSYLKNKYGLCLSSPRKDVDYQSSRFPDGTKGNVMGHFKCEDQPFMRWSYNDPKLGSGNLHICNSANRCVHTQPHVLDKRSLPVYQLKFYWNDRGQRFNFEAVPSHPGYFFMKNGYGYCLTIDGEDADTPAMSMECIDKAPFKYGQLWKWE